MTDARARIEAAKQRNEIAELNALMDEIEAEFPNTTTAPAPEPVEPEPSEEEKRYQERMEANEIAERITGRFSPAPLSPDADAKEIANSIIINGRTAGEPPQIKRAARYIDASRR